MATDNKSQQPKPYNSVKQCSCGASMFMELPVGEIRDGVFVEMGKRLWCVRCNEFREVDRLLDRPVNIAYG